MKQNIIRIFVGAVLALLVVLYMHWQREQARHAPKTQAPDCINNLKGIGIALRMWADDHNGQYPFNVSTNAGGTRELCVVGADGFAPDASIHFRVLTNSDGLSTPLILICPHDHAKKAAQSFASLKLDNVSYRLRVGTNVNESAGKMALVLCPIDGNTLYTDGEVAEKRKSDGTGRKPMEIP